MSARIISTNKETVTIEVTIELSKSLLKSEEAILDAVNSVGNLATREAITQFDTDGTPIVIGTEKWTSKGQVTKIYQTPYGDTEVARHVYQNSKGGQTYCPEVSAARIVVTSSHSEAQMVSNKYAIMASTQVKSDLADNHGRNVARSYLQNVSENVGSIIQAKEEDWHYATPKLEETIKTINIGIDGTTMLLCADGYRETMVGTISLHNELGERCHTTYVGATPSSSKATFWARMEREIAHVKKSYPQATYIGIADGAKDNWSFLELHTQKQTLDFYHATGYLKAAAPAAFPHSKPKRQQWLDEKCHQLKHEANAADTIFDEMKTFQYKKLSMKVEEQLESAITYFNNNKLRMDYAQSVKDKLPIGSGVTEAACKTVVKQRLCQSGISLQEIGAGIVLSLRTFALTSVRWKQFWDKINQYGVPILA